MALKSNYYLLSFFFMCHVSSRETFHSSWYRYNDAMQQNVQLHVVHLHTLTELNRTDASSADITNWYAWWMYISAHSDKMMMYNDAVTNIKTRLWFMNRWLSIRAKYTVWSLNSPSCQREKLSKQRLTFNHVSTIFCKKHFPGSDFFKDIPLALEDREIRKRKSKEHKLFDQF